MLDDWNVLDFPENTSSINISRDRRGANIVIFIVKENNERPIYVGETSRLYGRIADFITANFKAPNDFKVGEAIIYFREKGYKIIIKYKFTDNRIKDKNTIINSFKNLRLLNDIKDIKGYDYEIADEIEERNRIKEFCDKILKEGTGSLGPKSSF